MNEIVKDIKKAIEDDTIEHFLAFFTTQGIEMCFKATFDFIDETCDIVHKETGNTFYIKKAKFNKNGTFKYIKHLIDTYNEYYEILFRKF